MGRDCRHSVLLLLLLMVLRVDGARGGAEKDTRLARQRRASFVVVSVGGQCLILGLNGSGIGREDILGGGLSLRFFRKGLASSDIGLLNGIGGERVWGAGCSWRTVRHRVRGVEGVWRGSGNGGERVVGGGFAHVCWGAGGELVLRQRSCVHGWCDGWEGIVVECRICGWSVVLLVGCGSRWCGIRVERSLRMRKVMVLYALVGRRLVRRGLKIGIQGSTQLYWLLLRLLGLEWVGVYGRNNRLITWAGGMGRGLFLHGFCLD
mmetsp:Transcript_5332/g.10553  ORF Transcript_5332/g.10553 Transcript_5332/m.10553 type:complete len:263 (-) Transcript_5332:1469-2257(-)